jgi:hypothetical protein
MLMAMETESMGFSEVSDLLWQEREALELLLFKLIEERLIVASGEIRWLPAANREVESVIEQLQSVEIRRAVEVEMMGREHGRNHTMTLSEIASVAGEPWATILLDHREHLLSLVAQVEQASGENRAMLTAGARAIRETLLAATESVNTYDSRGVASQATSRPLIMDEQA